MTSELVTEDSYSFDGPTWSEVSPQVISCGFIVNLPHISSQSEVESAQDQRGTHTEFSSMLSAAV
jgi:hypothetical protein